MKKQSSRRRSASMPPIPVRHQLDHSVPTVIHDPEAKMTALGRLTHHVLQDRKKLSTWAVVIASGALVSVPLWNFVTSRRSTTTEVWSKLDTAKTAEDRVDVAKQYPKSVASNWALLRAANLYFDDAVKDMPNNSEVARTNFKKALDLFDQVAREAPKDSFQKRAAEMGKARSLEARFELSKAIEQYDVVVKNWPGSAEAGQARQLAEALQRPEAAAFYKELYDYRPTTVTLPPSGSERFSFPPTGPTTKSNLPGLSPSFSNLPLELAPPTLDLSRPEPAQAKDKTKPGGIISDLPADVFSSKPAAGKEKAPR